MASMLSNESRFSFVHTCVLGGVTLFLLIVLGRVAQLQLAPSGPLVEQMKPRVSTRALTPVRGDIRDQRGRVISVTRFGYRACLDPVAFAEKPEKMDEGLVKIAAAIGGDADTLGSKIAEVVERNKERQMLLDAANAKADGMPKGGIAAIIPVLIKSNDSTSRASPQPVASIEWSVPEIESPDEGAIAESSDGVSSEVTKEEPVLKKPVRFVPLSGILTPEQVAAVRSLKVRGLVLEQRPVREYPGGEIAASIVGLVGFEQVGMMGAEKRLNSELVGIPGSVSYIRDRQNRPLWIEPGHVRPSHPGTDVRISIDLEVQRMVQEELERGVEEADAAGGRCVALDPLTGEILAMVDVVRPIPGLEEYPWADAPQPRKRGEPAQPIASLPGGRHRYRVLTEDEKRAIHPALGRNRCIEDIYEPGSTFKPFIWAVITELGAAKPDEVFNTHHGTWKTSYGRPIADVTKRASMTWREVLINSSNIGMVKAAERLKPGELHSAMTRFGFGRRTGIELPGEAAGIVTPIGRWTKYTHTSVAYGHEVSVTPVQMARAFSAFCRTGELAGTVPQLHLRAVEPSMGASSRESALQRGILFRVLPPEVADLTRVTMKGVADNMETRWMKKPEGGFRYSMFGKSGTAEIPLGKAPKGKVAPRGSTGYFDDQYNSSFVAGGPIENPRLVLVVVIDDPGPARVFARPIGTHYGAAVAGPVARRVMERVLAYLCVPPSPRENTQ